MALQITEKTMSKKSDNNADISSDFLTVDGVAKYLSISRSMVLKLASDTEENFPKGFAIIKSERRTKYLYKKEDVASWVESKSDKG